MEPSFKFLWKSIIYYSQRALDPFLFGIKVHPKICHSLDIYISKTDHLSYSVWCSIWAPVDMDMYKMHWISITWSADHILPLAPIWIKWLLSSAFRHTVVSFRPCFSCLSPRILFLFTFCFLALYFMIFTTVCSWIAQISFNLSPSVHLQSICPSLLCR